MKLNHKIVHETIARQFNFTYYKGLGGYQPKNYTYFHHPEHPHEPTLQIELTPKGPYNLQTVYVMIIKPLPLDQEQLILDTIQSLYTNQTINQPCNYIIAFNTKRPSISF